MKIGIVLHLEKPAAVDLAGRMTAWMAEHGVTPLMLPDEATSVGMESLLENGPLAGADLVVSLGGDGTLLRAARNVLFDNVPVLGINLGRLGFLAEVDVDHVWDALDKVLAGDYRTEERSVLSCRAVDASGTEVGSYHAINEVVVGGGARRRLARLTLEINGELFNRYYCDGVILSTPTGSTAYSLSGGGPLVSPRTRLVIMTPIAPHSLLNRSLILSETDEVAIVLPTKEVDDLFVHTDGEDTGLAPGSCRRVVVRTSPEKFHLARVEEHSFYTVLRRKLAIWDAMNEAQ